MSEVLPRDGTINFDESHLMVNGMLGPLARAWSVIGPLVLVAALVGPWGLAVSKDVPSLDSLAGMPQFGVAAMSPDGRHVAVARLDERRSTLLIVDADTLEPATELAFPANQHVLRFTWVNNRMLVVENGTATGSLGQPRRTGELFSVSLDGSKVVYLYGHRADRSRRNRGRSADIGDGFVIAPLPDVENEVLIAEFDYSRPADVDFRPRIHRVNVVTGGRSLITQAPVENGWITSDAQGNVRYVHGLDENYDPVIHRYDTAADRWQQVDTGLGPLGSIKPLEFNAAGDAFYALVSEDGEPGCLYLVQAADMRRQRLTCEEHAEPHRLMPSSERGRPLGPYYDTGSPRLHLLEPSRPDAELYATLLQQFPSAAVRFLDFSEDGGRVLFEVASDRDAGRLYLFDRETQHARMLFRRHPQLDDARLASTSSFAFTSRDGVRLEAYITLPPDTEARNLPLVVLPHGGPYGVRDRWEFDPDAQVLATRGYAVLKVNFRGSGGHGERFLRLGYREWGGAIQDDIVDATRYVVEQGLADAGRICLMGGSFGAYSALMSAIREPDLYRCAIGYAGVYDLEMMFNRGDIRQTSWGRRYLERVLGRDVDELARQSPVAQVDRLAAPVLLVHGGADPRAPIAHARKLRNAVRAAGKPHEWLEVRDEAHGFFRASNRRTYYERVLAFLDQHIGARASAE